ncbi:cation:dicarboxylate symporter family transporter [Pseudomonas chlororaphis]|uniref:cation:dicarboxylate symporter family transporter n=1 Tax=Pseudomonas chlororaphis TaxID=587753 RepID=UPI000563BC75|nr:cation:dicarboxylase symporter family transporter [Pseudomonas chlororaphis]
MKRILGKLYVQVLIAVLLGALVGVLVPETGAALKPLGDAFIKLIKMLLAPVIFLTVVTGIARMESMKELGRVGFRALIYFEVVSTLALVVGLVVVDVFKPGAGMNVDVASLDTSSLGTYTIAAIFIAQATNTPLILTDQLIVLAVLMFTSKGSAGVTGSGFIILAATLASLGTIPVAGMVLLLGVDRFMSEARAITNTIGNGVGTLAIAKWVGALDTVKMHKAFNGEVQEAQPAPDSTPPAKAAGILLPGLEKASRA